MSNKIEQAVERAARAAQHGIDSQSTKADEIWEWYGEPEYQSSHWNPKDLAKIIRNMKIPPTKEYFQGAYDEHEHDFSSLADYIEEMYDGSSTERKMMVIRKDDFTELVNLLVDWDFDHNRGWWRAKELEEENKKLKEQIEELEGVDPLEQHLKSTAWNLNRIANVLEEKKQTSQSQIIKRLSKKGGF